MEKVRVIHDDMPHTALFPGERQADGSYLVEFKDLEQARAHGWRIQHLEELERERGERAGPIPLPNDEAPPGQEPVEEKRKSSKLNKR